MGCTPGHRGFSLGWGSALYDPRPRWDLRHCCHTPIARHAHPGQAYRTGFTLAEWLCRAFDRIDPARVLGPHHCLQRGASAPDSKIIRRLLQLRQNASVFAQGCADFPSDSSDRNHSFTPDPRRASPSLCPGLSFRYTQAYAAFFPLRGLLFFPMSSSSRFPASVLPSDIASRLRFIASNASEVASNCFRSMPRLIWALNLSVSLRSFSRKPRARLVTKTRFTRRSTGSACRITKPADSRRSINAPTPTLPTSSSLASWVWGSPSLREMNASTHHCDLVIPSGAKARSNIIRRNRETSCMRYPSRRSHSGRSTMSGFSFVRA